MQNNNNVWKITVIAISKFLACCRSEIHFLFSPMWFSESSRETESRATVWALLIYYASISRTNQWDTPSMSLPSLVNLSSFFQNDLNRSFISHSNRHSTRQNNLHRFLLHWFRVLRKHACNVMASISRRCIVEKTSVSLLNQPRKCPYRLKMVENSMAMITESESALANVPLKSLFAPSRKCIV